MEQGGLEDGDVVLDLGAASLRHALSDPDDVTSFLFTKTHVRVEHAKVELSEESGLHQLTLPSPTHHWHFIFADSNAFGRVCLSCSFKNRRDEKVAIIAMYCHSRPPDRYHFQFNIL